MKVGDVILFYHSNCKQPGIAGLAKCIKTAYPDYTAWDPNHPYYDPKSKKDSPTWFMVDVEFSRVLDRFIPLKELQAQPQLANMQLVKRSRLSVSKVTPMEFNHIMTLSHASDMNING